MDDKNSVLNHSTPMHTNYNHYETCVDRSVSVGGLVTCDSNDVDVVYPSTSAVDDLFDFTSLYSTSKAQPSACLDPRSRVQAL